MGNFFKIVENSTTNGVGIRTSIFLSGCHFHCKGCFNHEAWDFNSGKPIGVDFYKKLYESLDNDYTDGVTILGGEPLDEKNVQSTKNIVEYVRRSFPQKNIWLYTGYKYSDIKDKVNLYYILENVDVIVDGQWVEDLWDIKLKFRGSSNQIIWDKDSKGKFKLSNLN